MDLDNISDVETLRNIAKKHMVKMKKDTYATNGTGFLFKEGHWYEIDQDEYGVTVYSDDYSSECSFIYSEAENYLFKK